ncbi:MAG TPA: hypothetical protein DDZ80_11635, partial [Cyanobacteria bacterium UBA8803]|nr:hypothetical protein [Cyanobacteria bacterium UBA9273]HBL59136.1 hypothetical protein [Cyanobacteria bacterium UBA8803]
MTASFSPTKHLHPVSYNQRGSWFLDRLAPNTWTYNTVFSARITSCVDKKNLRRAFQSLVDRHACLRTTFTNVGGEPLQEIAAHHEVCFQEIDAKNWSENELRERVIAAAQKPINLEKGPVFRVDIFTKSTDNCILLFVIPHINTDVWTSSLLILELSELYAAESQGRAASLPPLETQYTDFVKWQSEMLTGPTAKRLEQYWLKKLSGELPIIELPTDRPRQSVRTYNGASEWFKVERELNQKLKDLSTNTGTNLYTILLSAFHILLHRYTNQEDIIIGSPMSGRVRSEFLKTIGCLVNPIVLRGNLSGNPTYQEFLMQMQGTVQGALRHQDYPFMVLIDRLQQEQDPSMAPIFQVLFNIPQPRTSYFEELALPFYLPEENPVKVNFGGMQLEPYFIPQQEAQLDLVLEIWEYQGSLQNFFKYNTDLFDQATISRMVNHYLNLLEGIVTNPKQRIADLPLLTPAERHQLLQGWHDTAVNFAQNQCIHQRFEEQVKRAPDAVAVVLANRQLTYRELNHRANQLARSLQELGVKPGVLVAICLERSLDTIVAILGILKAGGAYVPLDPTYPKERLGYTLADSQVAVVVTTENLTEALPSERPQLICLDADADRIARQSADNLETKVRSDDLAYIIYTSGSTGQPKGVAIPHGNVMRLFDATQQWFNFNERDVWTLFHSYAFDFSVWEIWGALLYGGRLVVVPQWITRSPEEFYQLLVQEQVTVLNQTPSAFNQLIRVDEAIGHANPLNLRLVIFGGEALQLMSLKPWFDRHGDRSPQLVNMYGITETTVHVTYRPITIADIENNSKGSIIGRPIPDLQIYILDRYQNLVPIGITGEIYVGGAGLARGYLNRPELTAERFITNPFSNREGDRLYRSGDLARYRPNGDIEYIGRIDEQIKLRGFRIELGEVEATLNQHPDVRETVAIVREDRQDDKRLVAYVVPSPQKASVVLELLRLEKEGKLSPADCYELPNGMVISHQNKSETEFVYQEIFEDLSYFKHGITLTKGACVFDVGANIGLFTLFVGQQHPDATIYAFEPIPPVFENLRLNAEIYSINAKVFQCGLAQNNSTATFTYYPHDSVISGRYANLDQERETIKTFLLNQQKAEFSEDRTSADIEEQIDNLLTKRLESYSFNCQLITLSEIIRANGIEKIDLLKIDVEKSELDVLGGIEPEDWSKIAQIVVEVHDLEGRLQIVTELLSQHGYEFAIKQDRMLKNTNLYSVYARRGGIAKPETQVLSSTNGHKTSQVVEGDGWNSPNRFVNNLRRFLQHKLPDYMLPSALVLMPALPLTANGKIDRRSLPAPSVSSLTLEATFVAPRTATEKILAGIWAEVLGVEKIGIRDSFFELGGHSLLAIQTLSRVREAILIEIPLHFLFESPTIAQLAEYIESSRTQQAEALPIIQPDPSSRHLPFPLTDIQQAYWIGRSDTLELGNIAAHIYLEIEGLDLNLERLNWGWQQLIERHDMLRAIVLPNGQQQILERVPLYQIAIKDLQGQPAEFIATELEAIRQEMSHQVLPTDRWPLFDIRATRIDGRRVRIHLSFDALTSDAWSLLLLFQEWGQLCRDTQVKLPDLSVSFRDYVIAYKQLEHTDLYRRSQAYWLARLDNLPKAPELPLAQNPNAIKQPRFVRRSLQLDREIWLRLKQRATQASLTPSVIFLTAFAEILTVWSKSSRFTLNLTLFNRLPLHPEVNNIVGDFTALNLLEIDQSEADTFTARALRIQKQLWQDLEHCYFSALQVLRELNRRQTGGQLAAMPVVFTSALTSDSLGQTVDILNQLGETIYSVSQTPQVWLDHQVFEQNGKIVLNWDTLEELFPAGLIDEMFASYCQLLQQLANTEKVWVSPRRQLIPTAQLEQRQAINATAAPVSEMMLHELFLAQVAARGEAAAVITSNQSLSYQQLYQQANDVAVELRQLGVKPNTLVAVVMTKGWEQIVAVLGILMAGAAYVPIDPELPQQRQQSLLAQAQIQIGLTQTYLLERQDSSAIHWLCVDTIEGGNADIAPFESVQTADDLAYVIFTSGSTGVPKGVAINHRGAVNTIFDINRRFNVTASDRVLAVSALNFDLSVYDIFGILAAGGTIVLPEPEGTKDPTQWVPLMQRYGVTLWNTVPALMQMLVEYLSHLPHLVPSGLRLALLSGDWLPLNLPGQIQQLWPEVQVISLGGATEASIWSIYYPISQVEPSWKSIPYGKPLTNQTFHVLDAHLQPCPVWVPGELYIGGIGLAQGYWQDKQKTAASFFIHPITAERLYKTGDLGRYLPDGNIEFLGREDFQVKINGYRIELGEIETALQQHPAVKAAVVSTVGEDRTQKRLIGYVVPQLAAESSIFEVMAATPGQAAKLWEMILLAGQQPIADELNLENFVSLWQNMDRLYTNAVGLAFQQLGVYRTAGEKYGIDELMLRCQIAPRYYRWLSRALQVMVDEGWLEQQGAEFITPQGLPELELDLAGIKAQQILALGLSEAETEWMALTAKNLANIITETTHSAEIYATETTQNLYQKIFSYGNNLLAEVTKAMVQAWQPGKQIRLLEVGAGYGSATLHILPHLPAELSTYLFTDISNFFIQKAQENFAAYPFVRYGLLDLDVEPMTQGYESHSFDVIIAVSVLHDARRLQKTMQHLRSLLAPGGLLVMMEETKFHRSFDLGMGLQQGFDTFEDAELRSQHPLLGRNQWQTLLSELGFTSAATLNQPGTAADWMGIDVIVAQAPLSVKRFRTEGLQDYLLEKLPEYMVPSTYVLLSALPLTANGKIDRLALPVPDTAKPELDRTFVAPRNSVEQQLAQIWCQVLSLAQVGIQDNFFEVGGDSLLATQVLNQVRQRLAVELSLRALFERATIADLAEYIQEQQQTNLTQVLPPLLIQPAPEERHQPFPLTDIQQAYWLGRSEAFELGNIASHVYLEIDSDCLNVERLNWAWQQLIDRHDMLRAIILSDGQQQILPEVPLYQITICDLRGASTDIVTAKLEAIREEMSHQVLPAHCWPLFDIRATYIDERKVRLHISLDILAADAWSIWLLFQEWGQLYHHPESLLVPLSLSFRDYVVALNQLRDTELYQLSQEYWFARLDSLPKAPELPLAQNPQQIKQPRFVRRCSQLPQEQWQRLKQRASQASLTPSGVLLAAFAEILALWSRSPRFTINLTLFNRLPLHREVNDIVGDFTSLTLVEIDNSQEETFAARALKIQKQLWQDLDHRYVTGVQVMRELGHRQGGQTVTMPVVFTSALVLGAFPEEANSLTQLGEMVYSISQTPQVWLDHQVFEQDGNLMFNWDAIAGLFPDEMLDDMFASYCQLIERLANSETAWISAQKQLLPASQLHRREAINATAAPVSKMMLHELFIAQVAAQGEAAAVITSNQSLSYQQLYRRANSLALQLRQLQVQPNQLVAVVMDKGWEQIVAVLGILIAGAAYVPIDPNLPLQRQQSLLAQAEVQVGLTQTHLCARYDSEAIHWLCVDNLESNQTEIVGLESIQTADDLAYVIF